MPQQIECGAIQVPGSHTFAAAKETNNGVASLVAHSEHYNMCRWTPSTNLQTNKRAARSMRCLKILRLHITTQGYCLKIIGFFSLMLRLICMILVANLMRASSVLMNIVVFRPVTSRLWSGLLVRLLGQRN